MPRAYLSHYVSSFDIWILQSLRIDCSHFTSIKDELIFIIFNTQCDCKNKKKIVSLQS